MLSQMAAVIYTPHLLYFSFIGHLQVFGLFLYLGYGINAAMGLTVVMCLGPKFQRKLYTACILAALILTPPTPALAYSFAL